MVLRNKVEINPIKLKPKWAIEIIPNANDIMQVDDKSNKI